MSAERDLVARLQRPARAFDRRPGKQLLRARILIVCEGEKTEPNYFEDLVAECRLTAADVKICGRECDSAPISVVQYAENLFNEAKPKFERVYCVIDRDTHGTFDAAMQLVATRNKDGFKAVVSYPCFEYWLLLHFKYSRKCYVKTGSRSPGQIAEADLNDEFVKHLKVEYQKGAKGTYWLLNPMMNVAAKHALKAENDAHQTGERNLSTDVVHLINYLRSQGLPPKPPLPEPIRPPQSDEYDGKFIRNVIEGQ